MRRKDRTTRSKGDVGAVVLAAEGSKGWQLGIRCTVEGVEV